MQAAASGNACCTLYSGEYKCTLHSAKWGLRLHSAQIAQWGIRVEAPMLSQSAKTKALQVNAVIDPAPQILSLATYLIESELILYENALVIVVCQVLSVIGTTLVLTEIFFASDQCC